MLQLHALTEQHRGQIRSEASTRSISAPWDPQQAKRRDHLQITRDRIALPVCSHRQLVQGGWSETFHRNLLLIIIVGPLVVPFPLPRVQILQVSQRVCVVLLLSHTQHSFLMIYLVWESELQEHPAAAASTADSRDDQ